ncbi:hypothetical protein EST38_g11321 [Candolleomyces aberdarensis]|uniref:Major facilitator superfamily (MFS) profile domain-containing protein n=1 Tax=Candolleomyces aberdarensis TaxID=2316362 RepID=A0A4Q2D553_9AGAR|nr:hypothetical protein EST38_g11321 [Candolleomyces aberdarensis]
MIILGWSDATAGPLLPRLREVYDVGFMVVSLLFVMSCCGFILGALANIWLLERFHFGTILAAGAAIQIVTFSVQASAPPFAAFVVVNLLNGFGGALQDALSNGFVGSLKYNAKTKMGILHAAYGLGAFSSPLVATQFAQMERWSFHYLVSLGLAVLNTLTMILVFRFKSQEVCLREGGEPVGTVTDDNGQGKFRQIMTNKSVQLLAFFILFYVGVEVTIGGWIVTYIIEIRNGGPSSGYISSGFFGGLTLGRVLLLPVNKLVGERRVLFIYAILAFGLDFVIWFVPSLVGNAVVVSIIGLLLGPMYPIAMNQASRILPPWILTGSIGWIAGFGQAGSALLPFLTGAIADRHGIQSLHPFLVAMMATMVVLFWLTPYKPFTSDGPAPQSDLDEKD